MGELALNSDGNDDFAARVAGGNVSYCVRGFFQLVRSIDYRGYGTGFNHFSNHIQVVGIRARHERNELPPREGLKQHQRNTAARWPADRYVLSAGGEHTSASRPRLVTNDVEDHVITLHARGEILPGVVDDLVGADTSHHVDISGAAYAGYMGPERLCDLHSEGTDPSRRSVDENLLTALDPAAIAEPLQRGEAHDRYGRRLCERRVSGHDREGSLWGRHVFGEGATLRSHLVASRSEDSVTRFETRDAPTHGLDFASQINTQRFPARAQ